MNINDARAKLAEIDQEQILRFYDELSAEEQQTLLDEIEELDVSCIRPDAAESAYEEIKPIDAVTLEDIAVNKDRYTAAGLDAIRSGKVAAVLLAGGQGTRLGINGPKGAFNIGINRELYIFECLINNLMQVTDEAGCYIPLLIMTSDKNDSQTRTFLKQHEFFGYPEDEVFFFVQEMAPSTDYDGKIYLEDKGHIALSPNGNGGWFSSLCKAGLTEKMKQRGVEWLNIFAVDNVLQRIAAPAFIGAAILSGQPSGAKVVSKAEPHERVGVMCLRGDHPSIVEYYELSEDMANAVDKNGRPLYNWGVILNYLFRVDALEEVVQKQMPLHVVEKKIPHIDDTGNMVKPSEPNGYKYETLVLDLIEMMSGCLVYEVDRNNEFAPVKNASGKDSPDSARELLAGAGVEL